VSCSLSLFSLLTDFGCGYLWGFCAVVSCGSVSPLVASSFKLVCSVLCWELKPGGPIVISRCTK
jgi:hypothetical protein